MHGDNNVMMHLCVFCVVSPRPSERWGWGGTIDGFYTLSCRLQPLSVKICINKGTARQNSPTAIYSCAHGKRRDQNIEKCNEMKKNRQLDLCKTVAFVQQKDQTHSFFHQTALLQQIVLIQLPIQILSVYGNTNQYPDEWIQLCPSAGILCLLKTNICRAGIEMNNNLSVLKRRVLSSLNTFKRNNKMGLNSVEEKKPA